MFRGSGLRSAALVTGGSSGLGRLFVLSLASMGYDVLLHYNTSAAEACALRDFVISEYGVFCEVWHKDFCRDVASLLEESYEFMNSHGKVRVLVNNASIFSQASHPFEVQFDDSIFSDMLSIHFWVPFLLIRAFIRHAGVSAECFDDFDCAHVFNVSDIMSKNVCSRRYFSYTFTKRVMLLLSSMLSYISPDNFYFCDLYPRDIPEKFLISRDYLELSKMCDALESVKILKSELRSRVDLVTQK